MKLKWFGMGFISGSILFLSFVLVYHTLFSPPRNLQIPTLDYIWEHGYPVNEHGKTYGPEVDFIAEAPDLRLVENHSGLEGYVKKSEDPSSWVINPEAAAAYMAACQARRNNHNWVMYLEDGETVIGVFQSPCRLCGTGSISN